MKRTVQRVWLVLIGAMLLYGLVPCTGLANVCSQGTGVPPFLSSGAKPNLLMVLDNSGSMLDAAYSDSASFCFDDTYDTTKTYAGYFEQDRWYKWIGPGTDDASYATLLPWESGHLYDTVGERVYANGIIWEVKSGGTSTGENITDDIGVTWKKIAPDNVSKWFSGTSYSTGDIVWYGPQLYQAVDSSTNKAPDGTDGANFWKVVDYTWEKGKSYSANAIVSYKGNLYTTVSGGTSSGTGVYDDSVTWSLVQEGSFVKVSSTDATTYCADATGEKYGPGTLGDIAGLDLCLSRDTSKNPDQISAFAARGNFLNWAMASKFDVEKKILTGGRYNSKDNLMMTEHRGCSGTRTIKQIKVHNSPEKYLSLGVRGSYYNEDPYFEDKIDSMDDTGRLEVLGITDSGYAMSQECQDAITWISTKGLEGSKSEIQSCTGSFPNANSQMVDMNPILNFSLHLCWQGMNADGTFQANGQVSGAASDCKAMYTGDKVGNEQMDHPYHPSQLRPQDGGPYLCYGIYDPDVDPDNRAGYVGRLWVDSGDMNTTTRTCLPLAATYHCDNLGTDNLCYWKVAPDNADEYVEDTTELHYRNKTDGNVNGDVEYVEQCTAFSGLETITCVAQEPNNECSGISSGASSDVTCCWNKKNNGTIEGDDNCVNFRNNADGSVEKCTTISGNGANATCDEWTVMGNWDDDSGTCSYPDEKIDYTNADCTQWEILGDWNNGSGPCNYGVDQPETFVSGSGTGAWEVEPANVAGNPFLQAIADYCDNFLYPEVIDPSDVSQDTGVTGNAPAMLRDSELMAQVGGAYPLATMKGYIAEDTRPQGIIHRVAGDLRLGAMAFHSVGAATECALAATDTTSKIDKYCPLDNMDGAELLVPLKDGELVTEQNDSTYASGKRRHVDDLAQAINDIRATSWTPLAEAMYGALGYYTQNNEFCLNFDANNKCLDWCLETDSSGNCTDLADDDPVQYWCQDNHILLITEGESTADINTEIKDFVGITARPSYANNGSGECDECHPDNVEKIENNVEVCYDDKFSGDTGTTDAQCTGSLYSSTYLDDMTWWGQNVRSLYNKRCVADSEGRKTEKSNIFTHVVTTGKLTATEGITGECDPATLMEAAARNGSGNKQGYYKGENPDDLEDNLIAVLDDILSRASAGSAASVISSSRSGSGAVYQAVFWPEYQYEDDAGKTKQVSWVGNVHSLFMNAEGAMYEDTDHDGKLDESQDKRVMFYFSKHVNKTRGCYDIDSFIQNLTCPNDGEATCDPSSGHKCVEIGDINYLWSANEQLEEMDVVTDRKVYTWNDANNNGKVDAAEWFRLNRDTNWQTLNDLAAKAGALDDENPRGPVTRDFLTGEGDWNNFALDADTDADGSTTSITDHENDALDAFADWILGRDQTYTEQVDDEASDTNTGGSVDKELRSRQYRKNNKLHTWRLGDVIHSTPIVVSRPAEAYNYIYRDPTYNDFVDKWSKRRSVVYFGANDGMLHAVNAGFYFENGNQFCCTDELDTDGTCKKSPYKNTTTGVSGICDGEPNLGEELWAYIPYNLQPHLKCLANKLYTHKYFVDQKPRIFDVQIFAEEDACKNKGLNDPDCIHPGGWGTILVGSMRFGGSPVTAESLNDNSDDKRQFISSFFILDITNPEVDLTKTTEPLLLGEMTRTTETEQRTRTELVQQKNEDGTPVVNIDGNPIMERKVITQDGKEVLFDVDVFADLNYTTSTPAMVIMRDGPANKVKSAWYLVMGNGPTEQSGRNTDQAQIAIFPLERLKGQLTWSETVGSGPGSAGRPTAYTGNGKGAFRILNQEPSNDGLYEIPGRFLVPKANAYSQPGFISDIISVDYNIDMTAPDDLGARYRTDAIYFATTDGGDFAEYQDNDAPDEQFYWNGGGRLFRLVTKVLETDTSSEYYNEEIASKPSEWAARWPETIIQDSEGPIRMLLDVKRPITAGPSIGYDGENYWIYAGTGRFWDEMDKTDDGWCIGGDSSTGDCWDANESTDPFKEKRVQAAMFGVKEPTADDRSIPTNWGWASGTTPSSVSCDDKFFTWQTVAWDRTIEKNNEKLAPANAPGKRGLMKTDDILVASNSGILDCQHCTTNVATGDYDCVTSATCFPTTGVNNFIDDLIKDGGDYTFDKLQRYIAGVGCDTIESLLNNSIISQSLHDAIVPNLVDTDSKSVTTGIDGWYYEFHDPRERNLGATALLGGLLTFTSYQPFNDKCKAEGQSFLYGLHYQTGTAWTQSVFGTFNDSDGSIKQDDTGTKINPKLSLGRGLSTTPSMHVGSSDDHAAKAFIQTSTGEIIEVTQKELPYTNTKSGRMGWTDRCE
ncbi:MAG: hypothetical protein D3915_05555 [Candidatus Electrothrix sp. AU1_5]|nr:hypothetical protein [Candidatus Electrothrix gigas]